MADIKHVVKIESSAEKIFKAITTKKGLESWWTSDVEVDERNNIYTLAFGGRTILMTMEVKRDISNEYFEWKCTGELEEWIGTHLIFNIVTRNDGAIDLNFTHSGWKSTSGDFVKCNTDWGHLMYYLKDFAEGKNDTAFFDG